MAAVLTRHPPPVSQLQPGLPLALDWTIQTCLEKDREDRWQTAHDLRLQLERLGDMRQGGSPAADARAAPRMRLWVAIAALMGLLLGATLASVWWPSPRLVGQTPALRFEIAPPPGTSFAASYDASVPVIGMSVSPDGSKIAFVAERKGEQNIWTRSLSEPLAHAVHGTEGGQQPFWSPDGRYIGFFANNSLKKVDAAGRSPAITLAPVSADPRGGAWLGSGIIVYAPSNRESILQIPAAGGEPSAVFRSKASEQRWWPSPLPDGKRFLFYDRAGGGLFAASVHGAVSERLVETNWAGIAMDPGYLLYLRDGVLIAQLFDAAFQKPQGEAVPVAEHVGGGTTGMPGFSASHAGIVAHSGVLMDTTRIVWYGRTGNVRATLSEPGYYMDPRISPDGRRVAWSRVDPARLAQDIWIFNLDRETTGRVTSDPLLEASPVWSPEGNRLLYRSNRTGLVNLFLREIGTGAERAIFNHGQGQVQAGRHNAAPNDWSADGRYIIYTSPGRTGFDVFRLALDGSAAPEPLLRSRFNELHGALSPDGRRLAFASDESGRLEVYVQSFPDGGDRQLISAVGGAEPHWRQDGRELYFLDPAGKLMVVIFDAAGNAGRPRELFAVRTPASTPYRQNFHPAADGQSFIVNTVAVDHRSTAITVVVNWTALTQSASE